ncbi:TPA: PAAR domain-containing protein [Photobacterium damselae]
MSDVITIGSKTSTDGVVLSGHSSIKVNGKSLTIISAILQHVCVVKNYRGKGQIIQQSPKSANADGSLLARIGDYIKNDRTKKNRNNSQW